MIRIKGALQVRLGGRSLAGVRRRRGLQPGEACAQQVRAGRGHPQLSRTSRSVEMDAPRHPPLSVDRSALRSTSRASLG